jgi:hypothetical protein
MGWRAGEAELVAWCARRCSMGRVKPAVLPVPVWARPMRSRPSSTRGMAWTWMGVGVFVALLAYGAQLDDHRTW